ncbi:hypothetical protein [Nocardia arthritidis]|nr:hypothetical protein [Nocardia arthritidis]
MLTVVADAMSYLLSAVAIGAIGGGESRPRTIDDDQFGSLF